MRKIQAIALMALAPLFFESCSMDEEPIGANVVPAKEGFEVLKPLELNDDVLNFAIDSLTLSTTFSQEVTYTANFKGLSSGAIKSVRGTADKFSPESFAWHGEHDGLNFFREGEEVEIEVSFFGSTTVLKDTVTISKANTFDSKYCYPIPAGDFEGTVLDWSNGWWIDAPKVFLTTEIATPQGVKALKHAGSNSASVYVTGSSHALDAGFFYPLTKNPDSLWVNLFVYGNGSPKTELIVEIKEADAAGLAKPKFKWENGVTDGVQAIIKTDHIGWKLFSFQYSALPFSTYALGGGNGNKIHESDRIQAFTINLQTAEGFNGETVEAIIDFPVFTIGGPFDPSIHKSKP